QGRGQRPAVDDGPAGGVDEQGPGLHQADRARPDQPARLLGQLDVDADDVGGAQQLVEADELDAEPAAALGGGVDGPGADGHADGPAQAGHLGGDGPGADQ